MPPFSQQRLNGAELVVAAAGSVCVGEEIVSIMDVANVADQKGTWAMVTTQH